MIQSVLLLFFPFFCLIINIIGPSLVQSITLVQTRSILTLLLKAFGVEFSKLSLAQTHTQTRAGLKGDLFARCQMSAISAKIMRKKDLNNCQMHLIQFKS